MAKAVEGCSMEAVLLAIRETAYGVDWELLAREALRQQLLAEERKAMAAHKRANARATKALKAMDGVVDALDFSHCWERYRRFEKRETKAWAKVEEVWRRRDEVGA